MVLHVIKSKIYSGAENVVCQIIKELSDREEFIYMSPHGPIEDKLKSIGLYDCYRGIDSLSADEIRKAVDELHPTVVHAHDFTASVLCGFALKGRVPVISHLHNNPPWIKKFHIKTISYLMACKYIDHILMVSEAVREEYRYTSKLKCPITIVGNPFSVEGVVSQVSEGAVGCAGSEDLKSDLLFVGRLVEQKNPMLVAEVAKELLDSGSIGTARMVGDGEYMPSLETFVAENHLEGKLILEGFKKNSYDYMANTKVQIMPSKWEGFGLVALEAMALGKPVVGTDNGGLKNIIDETCGYVCTDVDSYVSAVKELLDNPEIYNTKTRGALKRAQEYNNIKEYCNKLYEIYDSVR
ncbi:Glycosyltransferase involved in cell wall bisynthesis [Pseudobutyrivibrio sp. YE44]|uniref:glycosyltransferase n=1 Tax=Pseudobutyrivibrio sp. YE44 TaxID=1520802 RepID=UPI00088AAE03|nr:glycosyltransferase [Pseudobutyrivibrio sp. YE44]SDB38183.1 Glycosyltransferase involved in cell wall bisynthesis [Pseudobutyrivibrio sp. YE44]